MTVPFVTTSSTILCTHGGTVNLSTENSTVSADSASVVLEGDEHSLSGCPFQVPLESGTGMRPEPCIKVKWQAGSSQCKIDGKAVLLQTSVGLCYNAKEMVQGTATIASTQMTTKGS